MAKITYSALVSTMRGRLHGDVGSAWRGVNYLRVHNPSPRQPRTEKQQEVRGIMSSLAGEWYELTSAQKELWHKYASLLPAPMTGLNAYIHLNANLWRYIGTAGKITAPPPTPWRPGAVMGICCASVDSTNNQCIWTTPALTCVLVILDYSPLAGLDDRAHPRWSYVTAVSASVLLAAHAHTFPEHTIITYQLRSMDEYGRTTPNSETHDVTTPA